MLLILFGNWLTWLPDVLYVLVFLYVAYVFFQKETGRQEVFFRRLTTGIILFRIAFALYISLGQYLLWDSNTFTKMFLDPKIGGWEGFFLPYAWVHYWLQEVLAITMAFVFWLALHGLKKLRERFFEEAEPTLGLLAALLVGWPQFIVFLGLTFCSVVFLSLGRTAVSGTRYTTFGLPFLVAAGLTIVWGADLIAFLGLEVFNL